MKKIELMDNHTVKLGPGNNWEDVLKVLPPEKFTMIHGQCLTVGVGGFLLGGGINWVGTSEKYGLGAENVLEYKMVDASGKILQISDKNVTHIEPKTGKIIGMSQQDHGLFYALKGAGSSMGIVTEFKYRIYPRPETLPIVAYIFVENSHDLHNVEQAMRDGRYHISIGMPYTFRPVNYKVRDTFQKLPHFPSYILCIKHFRFCMLMASMRFQNCSN